MKITARTLVAPCLILFLACFVGLRITSYTTSKIEISSDTRNVHSISIGHNDSNTIDNVQYSKSSLALKRLAQFHEVSSTNMTNTTSLQMITNKSKSYHDYAQSWWRRNGTHTEQNNTSSVKNIVDQFHELSSVNNSNTLKSNSNKRTQDILYHYHDYAIFLVHYHKTGYVLSRELKHQVISKLEVAANLKLPKVQKLQNKVLSNYSNLAQFEVSGVNEETGERVAFDQLGNWIHSAFPQRQHLGTTNCPAGPLSKRGKGKPIHTTRGTKFQLQSSTIHIQESPDLFCSVDDLLDAMSLAKAGTKIIHLIRNPFEMTMSNFFYHSQTPTPEKWVHIDEPCQHLYPNNKSLSSYVIPALTSWARNRTDIPKVTQTDLDDIVDMCLTLWRKRDDIRNATFYEHLLKLDKEDALRLATAQMTIASSAANRYLAGGDLLRMANNIIKFEDMQTSSSNIQVLSMPMGDFITDTKNATMKFIDFVFGDDKKITHEMRLNLAEQRAAKYKNKKASNSHVMSNNASLTESKEGLRQMLENDKHLGPILNLTEVIVNEALSLNTQIIRSKQLHELSVLDDINTNNKKLLQAQFQELFNDTYTHAKKKKKSDKHHYHDYAIFIVYYHKTGCVLSHKLKKLINEVDVTAHLSTGENEVKQKGRKHENKVLIKKFSNSAKFEVSGIDDTGERVAFDTLGNWEHSSFPKRQHIEGYNCPKPPDGYKRQSPLGIHSDRFELKGGSLYIQASPDLFCIDDDLLSAMSTKGTKIVHFVRNPFEMAMSNYFYHSQDPTPEDWVHTDDPCQHLYKNKESLSSHVMPTLSTWASNSTLAVPKVTQKDLHDIVDMCLSLFQTNHTLKDASFYEHLLKLDQSDALRLATAQMTIASGAANKHYAGGDILRMANNIIRFQNLQASSSNVQVMSLGMGDFITDTKEATLKFLNFIFGDDEKITHEMRLQAATDRAKAYEKQSKHSHHITSANSGVAESKEVLRQILKRDKHLGSILNLTEILVNEALSK